MKRYVALLRGINISGKNKISMQELKTCFILQDKLKDILNISPKWWGTDEKEIYDNLIFVMPPTTAESIAAKVGEPTKELEQIYISKNTIFWSFEGRTGVSCLNCLIDLYEI